MRVELPGGRVAQIGPVGLAQRHAAMSLLLSGRSDMPGEEIEQVLAFCAERRFSPERLWVACEGGEGGEAVASAMVLPSAGRAAMIFTSPLGAQPTEVMVELLARLARAACLAVDAREVRLIQALIEPAQVSQLRLFEAAGFTRLAELIYMRRRTALLTTDRALGDGFEVTRYAPEHRERFGQAILRTYEQTLDCPALVGVRRIEDVLESHQSAGRFDPTLWRLVHRGEEPVGVMLLNPSVQGDAIELVYLGLCPAFRGQGLARKLLERGISDAAERGIGEILLAVDVINTPAMQLYRQMKFQATTRRVAMMFVTA